MGQINLRVGVDLGGTKIHSSVLSESGEVLAEDTRLSGFGNEEVIRNLSDSIQTAVSQISGENRLVKVGIGTPGTVDVNSGVVAHSLNLGIAQLNLRKELAELFGCEVLVQNDVNSTALGLARLHPELESLAYLNFGTGLAAGFVFQGQVWEGASGLAGEIGHLPVGSLPDSCGCGQVGCLELFTSWSGLRRRTTDYENFSELAEAIDKGLEPTIESLFLENSVRAITAVFLSLDPTVIFVGGGLISSWPDGFDRVKNLWRSRVASVPLFASKDLHNRIQGFPQDVAVSAIGALG